MKNKQGIIIAFIVVVLLVLIYVFFISPSNSETVQNRNLEMEEEFAELMAEVVQEQAEQGVVFSVKEIRVLDYTTRVQGRIVLECEELDYETDELIIESIANKLFTEYPNEFAEGSGGDSRVDVEGCSISESSSDGIIFIPHTTEWLIVDGFYDYKI